MNSITIPIRVQYYNCDPMGVVHHGVYPLWFEQARTELLRACGESYAQMEATGTMIVVVKLSVNYKKPAKYDDELRVTATVTKVGAVRIEHSYEVRRGNELLCTGETTLACLDREGKLTGVPKSIASA